MAPPELTTDTPVAFFGQPVHIGARVTLREESHAAVFHSVNRVLCQFVHPHKPLIAEKRLDGGFAAITVHNRNDAVFHLFEVSEGFHAGDNLPPRFEAIQPLEFSTILVDCAVRVQNVEHREMMPQATGVVIGVVCRGHLDRTGSQRLVGQQSVGNDRDGATTDRDADHLPHEFTVTLVRGMNADRSISQHRLRTRSGKTDPPACRMSGGIHNGIVHRPEVSGNIFMEDFVVGHCCLQVGVPVDQAFATVDQSITKHPEECPPYGTAADIIQRKSYASPVAAGTNLLQLVQNAGFVVVLPFPDPLDQSLPANVVPRQTLFFQHPTFHHRLSGNAGMVRSRHPQGNPALHPSPAS